jgi:2-octaprenylphenol hydroxylase
MQYDIIIVGGGLVGLTEALMLAQNTALSIAVLEKSPAALSHAWSENNYHHRVSAITLASKHILENLQVWPQIVEKRISPFTGIKILPNLSCQRRLTSTLLHFDSREINENYLGYIIENNLLQTVLYEKLKTYPHISYFSDIKLKELYSHQKYIEISTENKNFKAKLAIAADGANSWLRDQADIQVEKHDYAECAIVAQVETELHHEQIARQVFLKTGPLAFLPLNSPNLSSIVWTLPNDEAKELIKLSKFSKKLFQENLNKNFSYLGNILSVSETHLFPLYKQKAKQYARDRVVLIGDAAHTIHPLAGLGVNMGMLDAAGLFDVIMDAIKAQKDFSSTYYLRRYERARRADNAVLISGIDIIKYIFSAPHFPLQTATDAANYFPWLKNIFSRYATGKRSDLPMMAKKILIYK